MVIVGTLLDISCISLLLTAEVSDSFALKFTLLILNDYRRFM